MIPYGRQSIGQADIDAVVEVLRSDWLTTGPATESFEQALAGYCGVADAVSANSATSALHLACAALDLGPGQRLWTSPNTFVASANCARYCGADVDFVDIDPETYNLCPDALERKLQQARGEGGLPAVVVPVHFAGQPCDMDRIAELAGEFGFRVLEDASHAVGAEFGERRIGSCEHSDIAVFSFHPVKIITTGEGGAALTRHPALADRMRRLRSHGVTRDPERMVSGSEGPWYYEQTELGFNYRLTDIAAALGLSQLGSLGRFLERREELAERYDALLEDLPVIRPARAPGRRSSWHLYVVQLDDRHTGVGRRAVFEAMRSRGIGVNVHYIPVHLQPYYRALGFSRGYCPQAERYYDRALSLPIFPGLSDADQDVVVRALGEALR
jgi:UDP-4-amino-4,6-dideoxy-N-acetyl-beta-L-altrosamine transaminase